MVYNIPADASGLAAGAASAGALHGQNSWGRAGYGGPCPPVGRHRYFYSIYALGCLLPDLEAPDLNRLLLAMERHILTHCALVGTYQSQA